MLKNIILKTLALMLLACPLLVAQEAQAVKEVEVKSAKAVPVNATATDAKLQQVKEVDRATIRVENQLKRLAKDLELTDKQVEDARKIYLDCEKQQTELRSKIVDINKEKQTKFESLLTDEQKQKMNTTQDRKGRLREANKAKMEQLKSAKPVVPDAPQQEQK